MTAPKNRQTDTACRFRTSDGFVMVARPTRHPERRGGWYGGVSEATYARDAFSCGARYYYGDDIALLGTKATATEEQS